MSPKVPSLFQDDFDVIPNEKIRELAAEHHNSRLAAEQARFHDDEPLLFMSFGSGSSGNSCYVGSRRQGVLVDAGIRPDDIADALRRNGISMDAVKGVLVTHDHSDHVRHIYALVRRYRHIGVYATPRAFNGMLRRHSLSSRLKDYHKPIYKEIPFKIAGMEVTAFDVSHDGSDNAGFFIDTPRGPFAIATDMGSVTERAMHYISRADYLVVEANYDAVMLRNGRYPEYLKARIAAPNGHMDNAETAALLSRIYTPRLANVFLCHLSHDNNTPARALTTVRMALEGAGVTDFGDGLPSLTDMLHPLHLVALPRFDPSPLYILKPRGE